MQEDKKRVKNWNISTDTLTPFLDGVSEAEGFTNDANGMSCSHLNIN